MNTMGAGMARELAGRAARIFLLAAGLAGAAMAQEPIPGVTAIAGDSWVLLSWKAGDEMKLSDLTTQYVVFRSTAEEHFITPPAVNDYWWGVCGYNGDAGSRVFWDFEATNGVVYEYSVRRLAVSGTADTPTVTAVPSPGLAPFGTNTVWVQSGDRFVKLSWTLHGSCYAPEYGGISIYHIFRSTHPSFCNRVMNEITLSNYYLDANLVNLTPYYYMVFPCCPERMPSYVVGRPYRWARGQGEPWARTDPAAPRAVRLFWDPAIPGDYAPVSMYAVFRSDDGGATVRRVGTAVGERTFLDVIPVYGHRYLYIVRPIDAEGNLGEAYHIITLDLPQPINRLFLHRNRFRPALAESLPVSYQLTETGKVRISVFTPTGERVRRLYEADITGSFSPDAPFNSADRGIPLVRWDGANDAGELVAAGPYLVVLEINRARDIRTVAVIR
jgi:hypothetical protein